MPLRSSILSTAPLPSVSHSLNSSSTRFEFPLRSSKSCTWTLLRPVTMIGTNGVDDTPLIGTSVRLTAHE